jgi:hypothetical protein
MYENVTVFECSVDFVVTQSKGNEAALAIVPFPNIASPFV